MLKTSLLLFFASTALIYAQENSTHRTTYYLEIAVDEEHQYAMDVPESPYLVAPNTLQLFCNEKIWVECEVQDNVIQSMKVVEQNTNPSKTIEIEFRQEAEDRTSIQTILKVKNPFGKKLHYDAMMFPPKLQDWVETSILPVLPKLEGYELWPHAILTLVLENWKLEE